MPKALFVAFFSLSSKMHQKQTNIVFHHSFPVKSKITSAEMCDKIVSSVEIDSVSHYPSELAET